MAAGHQGVPAPVAQARAADRGDRLPQHRRPAARAGGDGARARPRLPARGRPRRAGRARSAARRRPRAAAERTLQRRARRAEGAARVRGRRGELVRRRCAAGDRADASGEPGGRGSPRRGRASSRARCRRRAGRVPAGLPTRVPTRGAPAHPRGAVPRDDRHRSGCRRDRSSHYSHAVARRRRQAHELERVLGANALFATAYGNVGSSIYYALGVTAAFALGLTPLVFVIAGLFVATAATYAEGTVSFPEAGGSSSFARHAFNEVVSFGAAWAQMLNYIITIAISAFFVPHYLSIFWGPLRDNPWDIVVGAIVIVILVLLNIVGIQEAANLNILL